MIELTSADIGQGEEDLVMRVLRSGQLAQGPMVELLETRFQEVAGAAHVVAVNSGTTALTASLQALGIGANDEVITSPFTFVATLNAILAVGARARFADIGSDFTLLPAHVEALINDRTAAILPVDLYGQMADMPALTQIARTHGLAIIEDAAQAHGADVEGRPAGSFGVGCFSLYATKNLTSGEGGLISTDDAGLADRLRALRNQGMRSPYEYESIGFNYRMTDLQAALVLPQLDRLRRRTGQRRHNAGQLSCGLSGVDSLVLPLVQPGRGHVWHQYTVRLTPNARMSRDDLVIRLRESNIASGVYYPRAVMDYPCFAQHPLVAPDPVPAARQAAREVLSIPVHPLLNETDIEHIVETVGGALRA